MKKIIALLWITLSIPVWADSCPQWGKKAAAGNINQLADEVAYHNDLYFNRNAPIISDSEYDALVARLKYWQACFPAIKSISPKFPHNHYTAKHQTPMGSLKKARSEDEVKSFLQRIAGSEVLVQPKIDGVAVELVYQQDQLIKASTRGNGETGVDILDHIRHMPLIPKALVPLDNNDNKALVLHGELFVRLDKIAPAVLHQYASARHLVAGQLNRAEPDMTAVKVFDFFPWRWIDNPYSHDYQAITALARKGFPLPLEYTHKIQSFLEIKQYLKHYSAINNPVFLLDGIVIKANSNSLRDRPGWNGNLPTWSIAWKFPPETATSEVQAITFTIGRTGQVTPVVHIEPVVVQNRTIATVSLGSIQNLKRNNLAVGDHISIRLKGSAIPVFGKVLFRPGNRVSPELPDTQRYTPFTCLSMAPGCEEQFIARLLWLTGKQGLDLAAISKPIIRQWVQTGIVRTLVDILRMNQASLQAAGMGQQASRQYLASLQRPKSLEQQVRALGIPGIGKQAALQLAGCITTLSGLLSKQRVGLCAGLVSKRMVDQQDYLSLGEVRELMGFLEGSVPTGSVGTR